MRQAVSNRGVQSGSGRAATRLAATRVARREVRSTNRPQQMASSRTALSATGSPGSVATVAPTEAPARLDGFITTREEYDALYARSIAEPTAFWAEVAEQFHWEKKWDVNHHSANFDMNKGPISVEWFKGGTTNICYNALDRHVLEGRGADIAFRFEGNDVGREKALSYAEVLEEVCRLASWLKSQGIKKGDCVAIYMPMVVELPIAMLACARIGAVHSVVFGGFSAEALSGRIVDCKARVLLTCSGVMRGPKPINLKKIADDAVNMCSASGFKVESVLVYENAGVSASETKMVEGRDKWWSGEVAAMPSTCPVEWVDAEHPLFLLYTSGSTGKPKGVVHSTGGFMVYAATTTKHVFNLKRGDVYWCTADCGWITGHSYLTYGPLINGATAVVFEGVPTYPTPARCWEIIDKLQVTQFYTAPTAIRSLMRSGDSWVTDSSKRTSLRVLGTVGEPINPEAWRWYHEVVGNSQVPVVDTWWQTETGGHMITNLPNAWAPKPGSATLPFFGVLPAILDEKGNELTGEAEGILVIKQAWPATLRTIYNDHVRYEENYFGPFKGSFFTGDGARRDESGYYWITGRVDDVINVSGHRIGTAEVESALVGHPECAEAAVVGFDHPIKGQGIYAFVTLMEGVETSEELRKALAGAVRNSIGAFAAPDVIHWAPGLPKTRSGKIMRRVLRKIASKEEESLGDISTLADPGVVEVLVGLRGK